MTITFESGDGVRAWVLARDTRKGVDGYRALRYAADVWDEKYMFFGGQNALADALACFELDAFVEARAAF